MGKWDVDDVLRRARVMLDSAELGRSDLAGPDPRRRWDGYHNEIVFGRAVTFVLQPLRNT